MSLFGGRGDPERARPTLGARSDALREQPRYGQIKIINGLIALIAVALIRCPVWAACNLIPQTTKTFDSVVGTTNRPFAAPNELIEVAVRPCDTAAALSATATDQVVNVLFTPIGVTSRNAVVLTAGSCSDLSSQLSSCQSQLGGGQAVCVETGPTGLHPVSRPDGVHLQFLFPDTDAMVGSIGDGLSLAGPATIAVTQATAPDLPCGLATATCRTQASQIAGLIACVDDFFTNDGACGTGQAQGVFNHFMALPYPNDFAAACVGEAPCNATATQFRLTTDQDGNALLPMDWRGILVRPGGVPFPRLLRASLATPFPITFPGQSFFASFSPDGGPLAPIFVPQFDTTSLDTVLSLFGSADAPYTVLRIARRSDNFQACHGGLNDGSPCNGPDDCPAQCSAGSNAGQRCTGDAQCPGATCSAPSPGTCGTTVCVGGSKAGQICSAADACPNGVCGPTVFTLTPLIYAGNGPVVLPRQPGVCAGGMNSGGACTIASQCPDSFCLTDGFCQQDTSQACSVTTACNSVPCVDFQLTADNPIPLASLTGQAAQSQNVFALTSAEAIDVTDRNGDGDTVDSVLTMRDSQTGTLEPLGAPAECLGRSTLVAAPPPQGRAVVQLSQPPFVFPAVAAKGNLVAFLESEAGEGNCDTNGNGTVFDSILRVFRLGPIDLTAGLDESVDAAPVLNGQGVVITNGQVFFRQSEPGRARARIVRASVGSGGQGDANSSLPALSADGRYAAFVSAATNLVPGDTNGVPDIFVRDELSGAIERVSVDSTGAQANAFSGGPAISADGRYVAFESYATNLVTGNTNATVDVFVHDRLTGTTERVSVDSAGVQGNDLSGGAAISADGRYVAFESAATNLVPGDTNGAIDVFVHDRSSGVTERASVDSSALEGDGDSDSPALSADGRLVAFASVATNLVANDNNAAGDVFVHDRSTGRTDRVSVDAAGGEGNDASEHPSISADGRVVAFESWATNLVAGDSNAALDVFVHDRQSGTTERASVDSSGGPGDGSSGFPAISADARYVAFQSFASNLVARDTNTVADVFVHDRLTGATERASVGSSGGQGDGDSSTPALSADGRHVAFASTATTLVPGDSNGVSDVFLREPDPSDLASDVTGDGDQQDAVLAVLDTTQATSSPASLCPADVVSVAGGAAAFLRPESAGATPNLPNCPVGTATSAGVDLNGNGSAADEVVHLALNSSTIQNLGVAATAVSLSATCSDAANANTACVDNTACPGSTCVPSIVTALVSEAGQQVDLDGDGDTNDTVVEVHPAGSGVWANLHQAADTVQAVGRLVASITPESAQGNTDLNGDGDTADRVLQIFDTSTSTITNTHMATAEFVAGTQSASCGTGPVIAFRTSEAAQGNTDLNGDGDATDNVLQVYVPGVGLINTHQAVTPCTLQACDPRQPYLVSGDTLKFLTSEADQGQDLNGNGTQTDLVLQIFQACTRVLRVGGAVDTSSRAVANPFEDPGSTTQSTAVWATTSGVCVAGAETLLVPAMCTTDDECPPGAACEPGTRIIAAPAVISPRPTAVPTPSACQLDVDGSGRPVDVATDIVYIARRLLGLSPVPSSFRALVPMFRPTAS